MKKFIFLLLILSVTLCGFSVEKSKAMSNYEHGINYIFAGETCLAESFLPTVALISLHSVFGVEWYKDARAVAMIALDLAALTPMIVGLSVFSVGVSKYHTGKRHVAPRSQMSIINRKIKMFDALAIASGVVSGIGLGLLVPGIVLTVCMTTTNMLYATIPLMIIGGLGVGVFLPMLVSSIIMSTWLRGEKNRVTPLVSLSHDEEKDDHSSIISGYTVKVGLKISL